LSYGYFPWKFIGTFGLEPFSLSSTSPVTNSQVAVERSPEGDEEEDKENDSGRLVIVVDEEDKKHQTKTRPQYLN